MKPLFLHLGIFAALVSGQDPATAQIIDALDGYWAEVSRTVEEGDFDGYSDLYHPDAVLVSTASKTSYPIAQALENWKQSFIDTRNGKTEAGVTFRFTQRLHDRNTAHETGILRYTARADYGEETVSMVHFQALLVQRQQKWLMLMEYQQHEATQAEWEAAD